MASIDCAQDGNKSATATWVGGVVPGTTDTAVIKHVVTVDTAWQLEVIDIDGGHLIQNANVTYDDASGAGLIIRDTATSDYSSNGTAAAPRIMQSENASPTNRWTIQQEDQTTEDDRTLDFSYVHFKGNLFYLGNDDYSIDFNGGGDDDPLILHVTPLVREPRTENHPIDGRSKSRVYQRGAWAGVSHITGRCSWDSYMFQKIADMIASGKRLAFYSHRVHVPLCRIEGQPRFRPNVGLYMGFTITVIEDE